MQLRLVDWLHPDPVLDPDLDHAVCGSAYPWRTLKQAPLFFVLMLQPVLEQFDAVCKEAPLVSNLDDVHIVGRVTPATGAFRRLCVDGDGVRSIGLDPRHP